MLADFAIFSAVRTFFLTLFLLPRGLAYVLCRAIATLIYLVDWKHRRIGLTNLGIAFPKEDNSWRRRTLLRSYRQLGDLAVEMSQLARLTSAEVRKRVRYEEGRGLENYLSAKKGSKGVLFLTAHISVWELLPAAHALHGHPLSFITRPLDNPFLERWVVRLRSRFGNQVVPKQGSLRRILRLLQEGRDVGLLIDQNTQVQDGVYVPLFGRPASTNTAVATLALRTSAPVVPGFIYPDERRGHYVIRFYPPVDLTRTGDEDFDIQVNTSRFNRYIEEVVREYPHCWLWGHRRFHTYPDGTKVY